MTNTWDYLVLSLPITADRATIRPRSPSRGGGRELASAVSVTPAGDQALHLCFTPPAA